MAEELGCSPTTIRAIEADLKGEVDLKYLNMLEGALARLGRG